MRRIFLALCWGLLALMPLGFTAQAQAPAEQQLGPDGQPKAAPMPYADRIYQAQTAQGWSKTYYESFKRSQEYRYLRLAADYCLRSMQILYDTQNSLKKTESFYYQTRNKRIYACDYYELLQEASYQLETSQYLTDPPGSWCDF
ncbi:MAG: hypothetical protein RRB13_06150 [bacterium]|nr:hypothetical protein [bacterium]